MIEIKDGRIYFYHEDKTTIQARDFQCLSAYVCPHCKNVLMAYFVGYINELAPFTEKEDMKHAYEMGNSNGGMWISLHYYKHEQICRWKYVTVRGIINGVTEFMNRYKGTLNNKNALMYSIENGQIDGFKLVPDEIGKDAPILTWNPDVE